MDPRVAARNALLNVLEAAVGERIVIVCDENLKEIGDAFAEGALDMGLWTRLVLLKIDSKKVRKEIPDHLREIFTSQKPDIFINLLRGNTEETPFRIKVTKMETRRRSRLGHCPGVTLDMLVEGALALQSEDYRKMQNFGDTLRYTLSNASKFHLTTPAGTDLEIQTKGRVFITDTKIDWQTMKWMNLPVGEVYCAPLENHVNGTLVADMSVGGIGKTPKPIKITVKQGKATSVTGGTPAYLKKVKKSMAMDNWAKVVGEFAFGVNPKARYSDEFLEAEKMLRTSHIAFGNNEDFGGKNSSMNHMDFLMNRPTATMYDNNGGEKTFIKDGIFKL